MGCPIVAVASAIEQGSAYRDPIMVKREVERAMAVADRNRQAAMLNQSYLQAVSSALALQGRHDPYQDYLNNRMAYHAGLSSHYGLSVRPRLSQSSGPRLPINTGANRRMVRATFFKNPRDRRCVANG